MALDKTRTILVQIALSGGLMNLQFSRNSLICLRYIGEPSGTRTRDPLIKSQMLYRPELTAHTEEIQKGFVGFGRLSRTALTPF